MKPSRGRGLGKPDESTLQFAQPDGSPMSPNQLSWLWRSACKSLKLPRVSFHALRHTHASALIAAGQDVVMVSRRLGHKNPTVTLNTYGHLFKGGPAVAVNHPREDELERGTGSEEMGL
jgi:integrase